MRQVGSYLVFPLFFMRHLERRTTGIETLCRLGLAWQLTMLWNRPKILRANYSEFASRCHGSQKRFKLTRTTTKLCGVAIWTVRVRARPNPNHDPSIKIKKKSHRGEKKKRQEKKDVI